MLEIRTKKSGTSTRSFDSIKYTGAEDITNICDHSGSFWSRMYYDVKLGKPSKISLQTAQHLTTFVTTLSPLSFRLMSKPSLSF